MLYGLHKAEYNPKRAVVGPMYFSKPPTYLLHGGIYFSSGADIRTPNVSELLLFLQHN